MWEKRGAADLFLKLFYFQLAFVCRPYNWCVRIWVDSVGSLSPSPSLTLSPLSFFFVSPISTLFFFSSALPLFSPFYLCPCPSLSLFIALSLFLTPLFYLTLSLSLPLFLTGEKIKLSRSPNRPSSRLESENKFCFLFWSSGTRPATVQDSLFVVVVVVVMAFDFLTRL